MSALANDLVHGTALAIGNWAILLRGPSRAGKSDLALRLMEAGADLISDDQVELCKAGEFLTASAPASIAGLLEVRGVGIVKRPHRENVALALLIDLVSPDDVPRMPDAQTEAVLGIELPILRLAAFEASTPAKIKLALASLID